MSGAFEDNNELMNPEEWDEFWQKINPAVYVNTRTFHDKSLLERLQGYIHRYQPANVLEVGCVCSKNLYMLPNATDSRIAYYGLDASVPTLRVSGALFDSERVRLAAGDLFNAPFKNGSFGMVVSFGLIEHYRTPASFLRCCIELLEPGGMLVAGYPSYQGLTGWLQQLVNPRAFDHHYSLAADKMRQEFEQTGLTEVVSDYFGLFNPNMIDWGKGLLRKGLMYGCFAAARPLEWLASLSGVHSASGKLSSYVIATGRKPD